MWLPHHHHYNMMKTSIMSQLWIWKMMMMTRYTGSAWLSDLKARGSVQF